MSAIRLICAIWVLGLAWTGAILGDAQAQDAGEAPVLSDQLKAILTLTAQNDGPETLLTTVGHIASIAPGTEEEILLIVAQENPDQAEVVAESLGLRPRTAKTAVSRAAAENAAELIAAAQQPRFWSFEGWDGRIAFGASATTGNAENDDLAFALDAARSHGKVSYEFAGLYEIARAEGDRTKDRYRFGAQLSRDAGERWYYFGSGDFERDRFSGFDYRSSVTPGVGYRVLKSDRTRWRLQGGPTVRIEEPINGPGRTSVGGSAESLFQWKPSGGSLVRNDTIVVATQTTTINNIASLSVPVYKSIAIELSNDVRYDFNPPAGTESLDTTTRASVAYVF